MLAHPSLTEPFLAIVPSLETTWQAISPRTNWTLLADLRRATEIEGLMTNYAGRHYTLDHPWMDQLLVEAPTATSRKMMTPTCEAARRGKAGSLRAQARMSGIGGKAENICSL
jgi:hypothetical protein